MNLFITFTLFEIGKLPVNIPHAAAGAGAQVSSGLAGRSEPATRMTPWCFECGHSSSPALRWIVRLVLRYYYMYVYCDGLHICQCYCTLSNSGSVPMGAEMFSRCPPA